MKVSGIARLVPSNFWVGSTPAQFLRGLHPGLLPEIYLLSGLGACIAEWSSHSTTMNIGTLRPGP